MGFIKVVLFHLNSIKVVLFHDNSIKVGLFHVDSIEVVLFSWSFSIRPLCYKKARLFSTMFDLLTSFSSSFQAPFLPHKARSISFKARPLHKSSPHVVLHLLMKIETCASSSRGIFNWVNLYKINSNLKPILTWNNPIKTHKIFRPFQSSGVVNRQGRWRREQQTRSINFPTDPSDLVINLSATPVLPHPLPVFIDTPRLLGLAALTAVLSRDFRRSAPGLHRALFDTRESGSWRHVNVAYAKDENYGL